MTALASALTFLLHAALLLALAPVLAGGLRTARARLLGRAGGGRDLDQRPDLAGDHVHDVGLALEVAVDEEQGMAPDDAPQPGPRVGPHRDVDHPRLVLEGEEDRALGRHRVLAGHHETTDPDPAR